MRKKLREAERELSDAGFQKVPGRGKGSHQWWLHEQTGTRVNVPRPKGDLISDYLEKQIREAIRKSRGE